MYDVLYKRFAFDEQLLIRARLDGRPCTMCLSLLSNKTKEQKSMYFQYFSILSKSKSRFDRYSTKNTLLRILLILCFLYASNFVRTLFSPRKRGTRDIIFESTFAVTQRYVRNKRATVSRKSSKVAGQM